MMENKGNYCSPIMDLLSNLKSFTWCLKLLTTFRQCCVSRDLISISTLGFPHLILGKSIMSKGVKYAKI